MALRRLAILFSVLVSTGLSYATGENELPREVTDPPFLKNSTAWADSVIATLSLEEKIAQLIMVDAYSNNDPKAVVRIEDLISKYRIGGLIFFKGGPVRQAELTNHFQSLSRVPLLIAMDAEWGLDMRLDSTIKYPYAISLGAVRNNQLIYEVGRQVADQLKRIGVHVNYAPDVDINNNPQNPVINTRSFGENRVNVTLKGLAFMLGMQEKGVMAVGKHFPGHGDTGSDSHFGLPVIPHNRERLDSIEFFPFRYLVQGGISGIMTGHLHLQKLDSMPGRPSSLSPDILNGILRNEMGFKGLIMTDAMNMKGMSGYTGVTSIDVQALLAGNDLLLMPADVQTAIDSIKAAVERGVLSIQDIDSRCSRMLQAKAWVGLDHYKPVNLVNIWEDLHKPEYTLLNRKLARDLISVVYDPYNSLPVKNLDTLRIASVTIGDQPDPAFDNLLDCYAPVDDFFINRLDSNSRFDILFSQLEKYNTILLTLTWSDLRASRNFGLRQPVLRFIDSLACVNHVILGLTANPYSISLLKNREKLTSIVVGYEDIPVIREMLAQVYFGGQPAIGKLPVSVDTFLHERDGIEITRRSRLGYMLPEEIGISSDTLALIDSLVYQAIREEAFPGCQVLAAKDGIVFYQKAFGYYTYDSIEPVQLTDIYDLASLTKITATLPVVMQLFDQGKIDLKGKLGTYLPAARETNKEKLMLQDILAHQAGLQAWIPFYISTMQPLSKGKMLVSKKYSEEYPFRVDRNFYLYRQIGYKPGIYKADSSGQYKYQVADHLWINNAWRDSIFRRIYDSPLAKKKEYLYSDLGFLLLWQMAEAQTGQALDSYMMKNFYRPLGAAKLGFNPLLRFDSQSVAPTENDIFWRRQLVQGHVHDMGAAMLGGVAGHAGLFSNANDLAKMMQLYLNGGEYGGTRFFKQSTVKQFTTAPFVKSENRRGLGFDKPLLDDSKGPGSHCKDASTASFGHTGFTGTMVWADPNNGVVFVFLSNRVYPSAENTRLSDMNVRPAVHQVIYNAVKSAQLPPY
ncbi:MAG: glycoside hydrolase family 3 N-terminal domain-containing protein [Bacteroidales bacterium]